MRACLWTLMGPALTLVAAGCAQRTANAPVASADQAVREAPMKVFVLSGQSNMVGFASSEGLPADLSEPQERVLIYRGGQWCVLAPQERFGPEVSFGHAMAAAYPGENIGLIKFASSGTSLLAWAPEWREEQAKRTQNAGAGPLYSRLMEQIEAARKERDFDIVAMLWMQGERDARFPEVAPEYERNLKNFLSHIRKDLGNPRLPFILARVNPPADRWLGLADVRSAQEKVAREDAFVIMVSTDDLGKMTDDVHYNADGLVELGRRYARAYLERFAPAR